MDKLNGSDERDWENRSLLHFECIHSISVTIKENMSSVLKCKIFVQQEMGIIIILPLYIALGFG